MSTTVRVVEDKRFRSERQTGFVKHFERVYSVGQEATLADVDLEEGDFLPDNSSAEIIDSSFETDKQTAHRIVRVRAIEYVTGS